MKYHNHDFCIFPRTFEDNIKKYFSRSWSHHKLVYANKDTHIIAAVCLKITEVNLIRQQLLRKKT